MKISQRDVQSLADMLEARKPPHDEVEGSYYIKALQPNSPRAGGGRGHGRRDGRDGRDGRDDSAFRNITRDTMQRILKYFGAKSNGYKAVPETPRQTVDVFLQGPNLRFTLEAPFKGAAIPQKGNKGLREIVRKERVRPAVDLPEYRLRFNLKREMPVDKNDDETFKDPLVAGHTRGSDRPRTYRYKKRWSFVPIDSDDNKDFRIDITAVRQIVQSGHNEMPATYEEILSGRETYEVEIEYTGKDVLKKGAESLSVAKSLLKHCIIALKVIDDTDHILSLSEQSSVLSQYSALAGSNKFIGPKPITLELVHLACDSGLPCVSQDYTVTDKADGERRLLFVADDKRVFTINDRMVVRDTGRVSNTFQRCILDGEHLPERFLIFDAMFFNGKDVRDQPLKIWSSSSEEKEKPVRKRTNGGGSGDVPADRLSAARTVVSDLAPDDDEYLIGVKEFMEARSPRSMAESCRRILHKKSSGRLKYEIDGLIFTPASLPMPKSGMRWIQTLKWKPPKQNTIDFQVRLHRSDELVVLEGVSHRVADLLVGQDPWLSIKLTALEMISGSAEERLRRGGSYAAVPFNPPGVPSAEQQQQQQQQPPVHVCYLPMKTGGRIQCQNNDDIVDGSVVEFAYDVNAKRGVNWVPLNVRWDKTETHRLAGDVTANNSDAADNVWRTILNPVTEDTLTKPEVASAAIKKMKLSHESAESSTSYYVAQLKTDDGDSGGLRRFHNHWVKKESLMSHFPASRGLGRSVFDFGCGRAGDLNKWLDIGSTRVVGIDKYSSNIYDPAWNASPSANVRLLKARGLSLGGNVRPLSESEKKARELRIVFLPMDASRQINSQAYIDSLDEASGDRAVARCLWGLDPVAAVTPPPLKAYHGFASNAFDLATCMFAIHYFFDKKESLATFCKNVATVLRAGGHFVGCCLDGDAVDALLDEEAPKIGDSVSALGKNGGVTWSIDRRYAGGKTNVDRYGRQIDVYFESIGQTFPEYLVNYRDLVEVMAENGLRPADQSEASALGLCGGKSTGMFEELFEDMKDKETKKQQQQLHPSVAAALSMSVEEKKYSWLNRWFVFVRA